MAQPESDALFAGSVPAIYERYLVPLIFERYADDLVDRVRRHDPVSLLEVAAGTGVVTRALASGLDPSVEITATDLNQGMIAHAEGVGTARPVDWRQADVYALPFGDGAFDAVVCQFGAMFFPDKVRAFGEVRRVLRPGGVFVFNVWDRLERNEFPAVVNDAVRELFPDDPSWFMDRTPHGYFDEAAIRSDVAAGGFTSPVGFDVVEHRSRGATAEMVAIAFCQGTPMRDEIVARDPGRLAEVTAHAAVRLTERFGAVDLDGAICGFVVTATA